jgi:hypothetical protein
MQGFQVLPRLVRVIAIRVMHFDDFDRFPWLEVQLAVSTPPFLPLD